MPAAVGPLVVCDDPAPGVRVARFVRPKNNDYLDAENSAIKDCPLYQELRREVLDGRGGGAVVLNFGLLEAFNSHFFSLLIELNQEVRGAGGRLYFCCLTPIVREAWDLLSGDRQFPGQLRGSEGRAVYDARQPAP